LSQIITVAERIRILLVDDEPDIIDFLSYNFVKKGFEVYVAYDGEAAYNKAILYQPHIIISDILMPKLNGINMCMRLKQNMELKNIPIIIMSASHDDVLTHSTIIAGAEKYLEKPVLLNVLFEEVGKALEKYTQ
jgi:two-component system, OmpR family, alkaline phosphatase synthesis response regulator PhoP